LQTGFSGTATFTALLSDGVNTPATAQAVNITVNPPVVVNNPPTITAPANPIASVTRDSAPFNVSLTGADDHSVFNWSATAGAGVSSVSVSAGQGTSHVTYSVALQGGFTGTATFTASLSDGVNTPDTTQVVNIAVNAPQPLDHIVISQVYGGGGNSNATYRNDFVELYNPTTSAVDIGGWTIQYASSTGTSWQAQPLGGVMQPGEYYLISLASGGNVGAVLPDANVSGSINMSATNGKVALSNGGDALDGCPLTDSTLVDLVGYGTADCKEGTATATAGSNTTSLFRKNAGATDTNNNGSDFFAGTPSPRRTTPITEIGPYVLSVDPRSGASVAPHDASITVNFTEAVTLDAGWFDINCAASGAHDDATVAGSDRTWVITPNVNFQFGEQCSVTVLKDKVHDVDLDDSAPGTDTLKADYLWSFKVVDAGAPAPYPPSVHLTMGNPSCSTPDGCAVADVGHPNNYLMEKPTYALSYNRDKGTPNWVSWHLSSEWYGTLTRVDTFRADPAVPADWYRVQGTDYSFSGFDRGHMTPNADRDNQNRLPINQETYLMSNMVPQAPDNNQGPWANLEGYLRTLTDAGNEIYIVSGPLGVGGTGSNGGVTTTIANGHVTVPAYTWKVALVLPKQDGDDVSRVTASTRTIAILMPNTQGIRNVDWTTYLTTVDDIEQKTGYDFFSNVPAAIQNSIEAGVNGTNPPGTSDESASTNEDTPVTVALSAVSPDSNATFTYTIVGQPTHGTLSGASPNIVYTPAADYNGTDSFTFKANDGHATSNTSTVTITVNAVNDAPFANNDSATTDEDTPVDVSVLANDTDTEGDALTVASFTQGAHGTVANNNGVLTYTPAPDYNGADSFTYTISDGNGGTATGTVSITISPVNDPPVAVDDSASTDEDTAVNVTVLVNDTDVDGDTLSVASVGAPAHGTATINPDGTINYSPAPNYNGADSFTYVVGDGHGATSTGTVNVTINAVNDAPVAAADAAALDQDTSAVVNVLTNDTDVDNDVLVVSAVAQGAHGTVSINAGGASVTYTPAAGYVGADSFTYTASDNHGGTSTASVSVNVRDTTAPVLNVPGAISAEATSADGAVVNFVVTATDNSGVAPSVACTANSGSLFPVGTTPVSCQATDASGNKSPVKIFSVSVVDLPPVLSLPSTMVVDSNTAGGANVTFNPTATDTVSGVRPVSCTPASGSLFAVGQTTVNCSATDSAGQTSTGSFLVYVLSGGQEGAPVPAGTDVTVQPEGGPALTFGDVTTPGVTTVAPISDPADIGQTPEGFAISNAVAFEIDTTATFDAAQGVTLAFVVPPMDANGDGVDDLTPADFNAMTVLHNHNGTLEELTVTSRNFSTRTIYAVTHSFSSFYLAQKVNRKIVPLFDKAQGYNAGSTVPVKVKLTDLAERNLSSSSIVLNARGIRLGGSSTSSSVSDSGNANPDNNFRFVTTDGGSYIYNLSTKGFTPGRYVLSMYVGRDQFFYTVTLDVK
ncbi:MAG: Ig-like domain-containing protein, partial [Acidobacteriota bacterium]|nr:Ig-like domain-containing protein [Acidobacteriota bacterium]